MKQILGNHADLIIIKPKVRIFILCMATLVFLALVYGTIQIWQTSVWLRDHTHYVREVRDPQWNAWMNRIDEHLAAQDRDAHKIRDDQKIILKHVAKHEELMLKNESQSARP